MRMTVAVMLAGVVAAVPAMAQQDPSSSRLRSLLEKNFNAPKTPTRGTTRSVAPKSKPPAGSDNQGAQNPKELLIIRPGGKVERVPVKKAPEKRSGLDQLPGPDAHLRKAADRTTLGTFWNYVRSLWETPPDAGRPQTLTATATGTPKAAAPAPRPISKIVQVAEASKRMRSSKAFGVVPDVYLVQFKNTVTEQQMLNVVRKYNLNVVGKIPALGLIYVKRIKQPSNTRSLTGRTGGRKAQSPESVLNPVFLQQLRKEPGVNAATVHSTVAPKTLPRPTSTTIEDNGRTFSWTWRPGAKDDGNWGLKRMRMPLVWQVLKAHRASQSQPKPVTMGFLDSGFNYHSHLDYKVVHGLEEGSALEFFESTCEASHGTHVAGIAGAAHGRGRGIDGIVPGAGIHAIRLKADDLLHGLREGVDEIEGQRTMMFVTAMKVLVDYLRNNPMADGAKRVINISLGFNWRTMSDEADLSKDFADGDLAGQSKKSVVLSFASMLQQLLQPFEKNTLFVIAAGNDSQGLDPPLNAKWSSSFSYLGLESSPTFRRAPNFLVVEAVDRSGRRASFSNGGGQVSAPGVDIMSTIGGRTSTYAICDGTSQAAPHVTALAAILMELAPTKTPAEIVEIITKSAIPDPEGGTAPRIDAFEAAIRAQPKLLTALADLNADGTVDATDLALFKRHQVAMTTVFKSTLGSYFYDHNENGQVEDNEHWYPRIDLNGSGRIDLRDSRKGCLNGRPVSDLDVIKRAWSGGAVQPFDQAAIDAGLIEGAALPTASIAASSSRKRCQW